MTNRFMAIIADYNQAVAPKVKVAVHNHLAEYRSVLGPECFYPPLVKIRNVGVDHTVTVRIITRQSQVLGLF